MSRKWNSTNAQKPVWFAAVSKAKPSCFAEQGLWDSYLETVHDEALQDESLRAKLHRGTPPDYCADCTARHQRRMHAKGLCKPPADAETPLLPIELTAEV